MQIAAAFIPREEWEEIVLTTKVRICLDI